MRDVQFLGQQLHAARERADFLVAVFEAAAAGHQLQVVDDHQPELAALGLQAPQLGVHVHEVDARSVVDIERRLHQLVQRLVELAAAPPA